MDDKEEIGDETENQKGPLFSTVELGMILCFAIVVLLTSCDDLSKSIGCMIDGCAQEQVD